MSIGTRVSRREDRRLLTGLGSFIDDEAMPDQAYASIVRSPHPHAEIKSVDCSAARRVPGVLGIFTAVDLQDDLIGTIPCAAVKPVQASMIVPGYALLCSKRTRFVGDAVAVVVAESLMSAKEASELMDVDYAPLPAVTDVALAALRESQSVWVEAPDNLCFSLEQGNRAAIEDAFERASHVTRLRVINNRIVPNPIEPRGALGVFDSDTRHFTLYTGSQIPHTTRRHLADDVLRIPQSKLRIVVNDVGGAFGAKAPIYREQALVLWAARKVGRPVRWVADRTESFLCDTHGRDTVTDVALAVDEAGQILGLQAEIMANMGAYVSYYGAIPGTTGTVALAGPYRIPSIHVAVRAFFTNTVMTDAYRGAGRPEAVCALERLMDVAAAETGSSPSEFRRRNFVSPAMMPYHTALNTIYENGEFENNMDRAMQLSDWDGLSARRATSRARGKLRGIGMANYVARAGGGIGDTTELEVGPTGRVTVLIGTMASGQGHATAYAQIVSDMLGLSMESIDVVQGDTDRVSSGAGTFGSRSLPVGGSALVVALQRTIDKASRVAAHLLEVSPLDIEFESGTFRVVGTDRGVHFVDVANAANDANALPPGVSPGLAVREQFAPKAATFPNGCHICEVEIDADTGMVEICGYVAVDDFGRVINPTLVEGQVHGGVAQGLGQALLERTVYCPDSGQLLSGSLMDYCLPRADDLLPFELECNEIPCLSNPLGVKGCGEAGTVAASPSVMNAVVNALAELGVRHVDMPATPERVWRAIQDAKYSTSLIR